MSSSDIQDQIEALVAEEHRLLDKGDGTGLEKVDHQRLQDVKIGLDQLWDLLRQRRAHDEFGLDQDATSARDTRTVEGYEQ